MSEPSANVILLHGLARTRRSMDRLEERLQERAFHAINLGYDSRRQNIAGLAEEAVESALAQCRPGIPIHFITHSLGGILLRYFLTLHTIDRLGRVVMLGPPNQGSEVVDHLRDWPGFGLINGEAGYQLGTGQDSVPNRLGGAGFEVGIIAGTRSVNPLLSMLIPGPDDGKVAVERTRLEGMTDHLEMDVTHSFMMRNDSVIDQAIYFLDHGRFHRDP